MLFYWFRILNYSVPKTFFSPSRAFAGMFHNNGTNVDFSKINNFVNFVLYVNRELFS